MDSLFARLLLAQIVLSVALLGVIAALFFVERNITVAELHAEHWAPLLAGAAGVQAVPRQPPQVFRSNDATPPGHRPAANAPRIAALREALRSRGVPVDDVVLSLEGAEPMVWLRVAPAGEPAQWLGVTGRLVASEWPRRALLGLALACLLLVGVSWAFTRRLTRPLEQLRARMQAHTPGLPEFAEANPTAAAKPAVLAGSPEIAAIDAAYVELLARLQRHERERALLLAGVSHDLRSPLARIRMAAELLPDDAALLPRRDSIIRNTDAASRLIESFVDHVRAGELPLNERVDLAALARQVAAAVECAAGELSVQAPAALVLARANRLLLERVLVNLLDNAFKHGRPPVQLRLSEQDGQACLEVEDAGPGMDPAIYEAVQPAFARADASRSTPGSGLGLAIVRQVVARHGGSLRQLPGTMGHAVRICLPMRG